MWEIYAYQNADSLYGVFNAAAAIHASGDYASAIAAVAFCGFVAALIAYAFAPEKLHGWKWLASVMMVFSVLIVPKVTIGIVDKTGGAPVKMVANVLFGVAALGSITSTIGHTLTGLFETAFQVIPGIGALPAELSYQQNGLMFGNRLIRETSNAVFQDPGFRTDLVNFIHNCTTYDLLDGTLDPTTFSTSENVWPLMSTPNPARFSTIAASGGPAAVDTCPNVYASLDKRMPAQIQRIQGRLTFQLNPTLPAAVAATEIAGQIQQAYLKNRIADAAATAADIIRQNAMLNALEDTNKIVGQKVNDPAAMILAVGRSQAVAQQNATWLNYGKVAEQGLPVFRNVIEAVTYAMFPLFVLLLLLTSGRETMLAFKGYAAILIWIQLWPPLYAILNYMASVYAAYDLAAAADLGTGTKVLSLQTSSVIYSRAISGEAIVGYLSISIPFIAWAALKRMENFGSAMVGGLSGLQALISGSTSSATVGNTSMGNVSMDQTQLAPNRTSAFMSSWQSDLTGDTFSQNALTGRSAVSLLRNQGFASRVVSVQASQDDVQDASRQVAAARGDALAASNDRSAVLTEAFSKGLAKLHSARDTSSSTSSSFEQLGETMTHLDQVSKSIATATGLTQSQVARIAFAAAGKIGLGGSNDAPSSKKPRISGGIGADTRVDKTYSSQLSQDERRVIGSMTNAQFAEFKQFGDRVSRDEAFAKVVATDAREARDLSSRLSSSANRVERAEAALAERTSYAERVSTAYRTGETISIDIAQDPHNQEMFMRYAEQYGGDSASAHVLMHAELARQSFRPNQAFSDGAAVPQTFGDIRNQHAKDLTANELNPDLANVDKAHRRKVGKLETRVPDQPTPPSSDLRKKVHKEGEAVQATTASDQHTFQDQAQITSAPHETLKSRRSLAKDTAVQVKNDASALIENTWDAISGLFKK